MVTSDVVARGLIAAYTIYSIVAMALFAWFAYRITRPNQAPVVKPVLFYSFTALLVVIGVSLHLTSMHTIPWVEVDMHANKITPDRVIRMEVDSFHYYLVTDTGRIDLEKIKPLRAKKGEKVLFNVYSKDLTYGFGLFRPDTSMLMQMQVLPLYENKLLWHFMEDGTFDLRSTEYSGPKGTKMYYQNFLVVEP
jgi:cytochrome c oxidase subunit 2